MAKKRIAVVVLILAVIAGAVYYFRQRAGTRNDANMLSLSGNIETNESVVGFRTQGRIIELRVDEGYAVKEGDLLARLDDADYRRQVDVNEAELSTRRAELTLGLAGSREQDIQAAHQTVLDAAAELQLRKTDRDRYQKLYARDAISAQTLDTAVTAYQRAQASYERAVQNYSEVEAGTRKEQIAVQRAAVRSATQNLDLAKVRLSYTELYAPVTGVVTTKQAQVGEVMSAGTPVVTIADLDHVWLRTYVPETDLAKVRWGQPATIRTDSYPNKTYHGTVSFISPQAEFTPKSIETHKERVALVYRIKINIDNQSHELKPGMPADATIDLQPSNPQAK